MQIKPILFLIGIVALGSFFRFFGLNWDQGFHLHPDERFLTMVSIAGKIPGNFFTYLDPTISPFNPINNNFPFFVYGIFPLTLIKLLAIFLQQDTYDLLTLLGRSITAFTDTLTILLVFLSSVTLTKRYHLHASVPYFSAFLYAIAVFPIQMAHFFTVDTFLTFFLFLSFYLVLLYQEKRSYLLLILGAVFFGTAIACKMSAFGMLPLLLGGIFLAQYKKGIVEVVITGGVFLLVSYFSLRLADPYIFASANMFDARIHPQFITSITTLTSYNNPTVWYPPGVQWIHKTPIFFSLINMFLFGLGPLYFLFTCVGAGALLWKKKRTPILIVFWVGAFFLYQSVQYVKTMRYFLYLYPFFAIFAGIGFAFFTKKLNAYLHILLFTALFVWPLFFINIYTQPHTRVTASYWIQQHIPSGSTILTEYWDDPLPLRIPGVAEKRFRIIELPVFDKDDEQKWQKLSQALAGGDYLILSSNRGWGSIPTVPERYPKMAQFYTDLFSGKLPYKRVAEFTSYPSLAYLGIPLTMPDDTAEEAFTVFDHPKVLIFKKE